MPMPSGSIQARRRTMSPRKCWPLGLRSSPSPAAPPGRSCIRVETVGAGDAFMAAFLWDLGRRGLINRQVLAGAGEADLAGAAALACQAAAIVCGRAGAEPPFAAELATTARR